VKLLSDVLGAVAARADDVTPEQRRDLVELARGAGAAVSVVGQWEGNAQLQAQGKEIASLAIGAAPQEIQNKIQPLHGVIKGVDTVLWFQVRDQAPRPSYAASSQSGVMLRDGRPKPARRAFAFPFVAVPARGGGIRVWVRAPEGGTLTVERRAGRRWRDVRSFPVARGQVVSGRIVARPGTRLRSRVNDRISLSAVT